MTFPDFLAAHLGARDVLRVDPFPPGASIPPFVVNVLVNHEDKETGFQVDGTAFFRRIAEGDPLAIRPIAEAIEPLIDLRRGSSSRVQYLLGVTEALEHGHTIARAIHGAGYPAVVKLVESEPRPSPSPPPRPVAGWGKS